MSENITVESLQKQQRELRDVVYQKWNEFNDKQHPEVVEAIANYDATVTQFEKLLSSAAPCHIIDCDLWGAYSDFYKEVYGFRPRDARSRAEVQAWFKAQLAT